MDLPVVPPITPMLARLARELPRNGFLYEPKWDGFRCVVFRDASKLEMRSRHDRRLARYFPELVEAFCTLREERFVLDGEIIIDTPRGFDFAALLARLHPAKSRVERLRRETPASFVAFDVLAVGEERVSSMPFVERRRRLEELLASVEQPIHLTPITSDVEAASAWLERFAGGGIDGVVAKHRSLPYQPGKRVMVKVKKERTADCVVAGYRWTLDRPGVASLLLGLYDDAGELQHVGVVASFKAPARRELLQELQPLKTSLEGHPWERGWLLGGGPTGRLAGSAGRWTPEMEHDWQPVLPERVVEVAYDELDGFRFRHPARFVRWRPDREPRSCTVDQLAVAAPDLASVLALARTPRR